MDIAKRITELCEEAGENKKNLWCIWGYKYIGKSFVVKEYGDVIHIAGEFPDEFTESKYTKKL